MFILNAGSITFRNALFLQAAERRYCLKTDVNSGRAWEYQRRLFQDTHRLLADHFGRLDSSELNAQVCRYHERLAQQSCAVLVRERPAWGNEAPVLVQTQNQVALKSPSTGQVLPFSFDACASPTDSQRVVWSKINGHALVESMVDGPSSQNGETIGQQITILAYGQTGSGKTFTMFGPEASGEDGGAAGGTVPRRTLHGVQAEAGAALDGGVSALGSAEESSGSEDAIVPRFLEDLLERLHLKQLSDGRSFEVAVGVFEIYNETVYDLMAVKKEKKIEMRRDGAGGEILCRLTQHTVRAKEALPDVLKKLKDAVVGRRTRSTLCNNSSSRPHLLIRLVVEQLIPRP
eukprot:3935726-Rhodomonas_salina.1